MESSIEPRGRVSLRDEQKRFTRQRLIDAAREVFERAGYANATIEDITRTAGASRATFYLHFKGKAEIVNELFLLVLLPDANAIYEQLHELTSPTWVDVRGFVEGTLAYWDRHAAIIDILQQAHAVEREAIGETWSFALTDTASVLGHYIETVREVDAAAAKTRAIMLIGLLDRFWFFTRLPGVAIPRETALDALADFWWTAFQPQPGR
jgi:AcrR family transcriptional regulator